MKEQKDNQGIHVTDTPENEMTTDTTAQVIEGQSELDNLKAENDRLRAENADLVEKLKTTENSLDWNRRQYIEYMNQRDILKKTLEELCSRKNICVAEMYEAMMTANEMDLDMVLTKLGKNL